MNKSIPTMSLWLEMTDSERVKCQNDWDVYKLEGENLVDEIVQKFINEYGSIKNVNIIGKGVEQGGCWTIAYEHPFIFDKRSIPEKYLGIGLKAIISEDLPYEFQIKDKKEYVWSPERYEKFVDRCAEEILEKLGGRNMSRYEMLCALCGRDYNKYVEQCKEWVRQGLIPTFHV
jgi:hypothetical protein